MQYYVCWFACYPDTDLKRHGSVTLRYVVRDDYSSIGLTEWSAEGVEYEPLIGFMYNNKDGYILSTTVGSTDYGLLWNNQRNYDGNSQ